MRSTVCLAMDRAESGVIATTPPITCNMEERLSQASSLGSGTHLSSVSGFSLGEVIVQRAKQGCELWPQLQSEAGTGGVASASASPLLLGGTDRTQTLEEFPTMEEGTITITEELGSPYSELGPFQTLQTFELQKSDLSPTLALVTTCSVEGDMSESFHRSPLEFAPLRPAPDLSGVSHEGCPGAFRANNLLQPLVSAVSSGHVKGSPSPSCEEQTARHGSDAWILSQCPLKSPTPGSEATEDEDVSHTDSYIQDQRFMELPSLPLGRESYRVPFLDCGPLLAQEVPTHPLSEQLDLLGHSGMQASGVHSNQNSGPPRLGAITRGSMAPGVDGWRDTDQQCSNAEDGQASLQPLQNQRDPEISYQHQPGGEAAQPSCPNGSHEPSSAGGPDASGSGGTTGTRLVTSITNSHTPNNDKVDTAIKVLPNRGSKEQESQLSPVVCLLSCTNSFLTPTMAAPLCQSTPTSYPSGQGRQAVGHQPESAGPLGFLSAPSCEELKSHCASREPVPPGTWQSSPAATLSLPPLGYLEKARASNPGMPLSFDSLVLRGLRGVSPRQRAYSAIADSLNHVLARSSGGQDLGRSPKRNIAVAFGAGPGSVQTAGGTGGCSHAGIRSDSPDRTSFCKPDPSPCPPKDVGNCSVDSLGSDSANSEGLQPGHSAADLLQQEVLPEPSSSKGQEEDSLEQNSGLPEHRILSPFPEPLIAAHTHQFKTTFTEDGMNPQASSLDTSQAGERTLTTSGHSLTSLEVDNYVPMWAPSSLTTEINHFNIDDRIPVYLRNLGIDQSPTSILGSRGLLKEVEFSASEQKVLQEPGLERFSVSEEVSAKDRDSVCTFYSDVLTHSTSITLGVETGRNTPSPGGPSLGVAEMKGLEPVVSPCPSGSNDSSTWRPVQALFLPKASLNQLDNAAASSLLLYSSPGSRGVLAAPVADPGGIETPLPSPGGCRTYHLPCNRMPRRDDSFIGSKTLSEIRRLLSGEKMTNSGQDEAMVLGYDEKEEPLCQWDQSEPLTQWPEAEVGAVRVHPPTGGNPKGTISSLLMEIEPVSVRRSSRVEPEGCSGANLGRVVPRLDPGHHTTDSSQLTTTTSLGQAVPCLPGQPSRAWAPTSNTELGDSVDSSHVDIPDARETNPLAVCHPAALARNFSPAVQTMDPTIPGGEETKRSAQPLDPLSMLDEEDRRKIEEIKAELLQKAKTSIGLQCTWSVKAKDSSLALDPGWPACSLPTCLPLSSTRSQIHTQDWGPLDKQWNMDKLLGTFGAGSPPTPIAAITICSRRKTPSSSPSLSASLLMAPSDHEQPPAHLPEAKVSAIEPAQCSESTVDNEEGQFPQEDRLIAKPITVRQDIAEAAEGLKDGDSISAPLRSPTRTVMSHIRVTLSPNRTRSPLSPSGKPLLLSGTQPSPSAEHSIPGTASPSPPYPPLPMPMPAICPTFPSLPDHSPGAMFPGTEQPLDQVSPEMRTLTVQGSSKVDVSTQTSGLAFTPPARSMLSQAASQDVGVSSEGTPSIPAPVTGGTTDVSGHGLTIDVPLMLPYKPAGSSKLFYVPSSGARHRIGLMDSKNSGEISQTDLNNVPPPGPQSQVLPTSGSHRALGKGTEHWNGRKTIASKETRSKEERDPRSHRNLHTQRAGGLESSPRHGPEDEGTQYRASRHPKERQQMAGSRHAPLQHTKREAWFGPCPLEGQSGFSYKERAKAAVKSAWEQPVPVDRPRGSALDELWEHFQERQQRHWSLNSSTASELSLLQRLDRLAQLLRDPCSLAAGRPRSPSITSMADSVRFLHDPGSSSPRVPSTESATSGPSDSSSAASTIDTARLVRAFGPERVLPLNGLYGTIQRQRERSAPRRERPRKGETRCPGAPGTRKVSAPQALTVSSSTSDSVAGRRGSAWLPHRPSRRLLSKKVTRLVDQGVQAGSLEIVPGATRRQTRDVGVTFPSPDPDVTLQRLTRPGDRRKGVFQTEMKPGKDHRTPAVAWYIPAHELQGDWRKENTNKPSLNRPVQAWAQWGPVPQPWREPLRQRHLQEQWVSKEAQDTRLPPPAREDGVGGKFLSTLVPLTLREALTMNKPWFISHSQERVRRLALLVEERKLQSELQSERDRLFNQPPSRGFQEWRSQHPDYSILFKKKISKQEMLDRSKRLYEQLPEVLRKREEEKRKTEYRANRLKAQLYKQKITNRVLGKKVSWQ
ncbi:uncharacterized protein alms1 isoform X1 [Mobula hypostoma]|uniref:uncharacterized protein alms1 isoform X1 n=1 Tax=Mobula hypostoma TaxID=723540 RepID=UPI002FC30DBE